MSKTKKLIRIAHSPDSDDAFMFYALKHGKVTSPDFDFEIERRDIEELNQVAKESLYDITAISIHAYAHLHDKYALTSSGASMAEDDYGPLVVAKQAYKPDELNKLTVAVPGEWTTAFLVLKLFAPQCQHKVIRFDRIMDAVQAGEVDAGLIIHEGQLQYEQQGLHQVISLTEIWQQLAGDLPLPLGGNAVKKSLGTELMQELSGLQKQSILYANAHHSDARDYAMQFKRELTAEQADRYLNWYANERTVDMGIEGKKAIELLFDLAFERGFIPKATVPEIV